MSGASNRLLVEVSADDHSQGPLAAEFVLVQYGDYECPYTRRSLREVEGVRAELGPAVRWVYRNFPLSEIHPHALRAAEAAEAAAAQGRFWDMHALLFARQQALEEENLYEYARELDLDLEVFAHDLATGAHLGRIGADLDGGVSSGVRGTPTFFANGVRHDASYSASALVAALRATGRIS